MYNLIDADLVWGPKAQFRSLQSSSGAFIPFSGPSAPSQEGGTDRKTSKQTHRDRET